MTADAVGGVWDYALELCRGLGQWGVETVLAVMGPPPDEGQRQAAAQLAGVELAVGPYRLEWMDAPWADVAAAGGWLLDLERRHGCDLVHLNGYAHAVMPFASPKVVVGHSCVLSWWEAVRGGPAPASWDRYGHAVSDGLAAADQVIAPTAWMLAALERHHGPLPAAAVIANGRDETTYRPGSADKRPLVLSAGRVWDEAKNMALLARVAPRLPWAVWIAGSTEGHPVTGPCYLGKVPPERLAALYAEAGIYVSTALYEPFGLTVLEAALSQCALVLSDIPSFREQWDGAAHFVPPGDEEALTAALLALIAQPARRAVLGRRARRRALACSASRMVDRYLSCYRRLLGEEVRPSCAS
jgi:glycogen(starch) synthase